MKLAIGVMCVLSVAMQRGARADCRQAPARPATIDVYDCSPVNNADGQGAVVRGSVTWKKGGTEDNLRLWVPGTEMLECSKLLEPGQLAGSVEKVCCEPSTGAVCETGANAVVSNAKIVPPRPVKQATRGQLESEVAKLRAENARLRAQVFEMNARLQAENERLQQESKALDRKLK